MGGEGDIFLFFDEIEMLRKFHFGNSMT